MINPFPGDRRYHVLNDWLNRSPHGNPGMAKTEYSPAELAHAEWYLGLKDASTASLLDQVLTLSRTDSESEDRWNVVHTLRSRGDEETFAAASIWCTSTEIVERELAADLLGQFGGRKDGDGEYVWPFADRAVPLLEKLIDDPEAKVVASAVHCLGDYNVFDPILARLSLAAHASADVRWAVACGLADADSKAAIDMLIALTNDEDSDIRDWATFGLGTQCDLDTPDIREALARRLDDKDEETRDEAMVGLSRRKDAEAVPYILKELTGDGFSYMAVEAAGHMASSEFVKSLEDLRPQTDREKDLLEGALNRCQGLSDPEEDRFWVQEGEIVVPDWATGSPTN